MIEMEVVQVDQRNMLTKSFDLHHALLLTYDIIYDVILLFFANFTTQSLF